MKPLRLFYCVVMSAVVGLTVAGCSATKFVPEGEYLLEGVRLESEPHGFNVSLLDPYIRQRGNAKWFGLLKVPLGTYSLSGRDTTVWLNRLLRRMGEAPVVWDSAMAMATCQDLQLAMRNMGYLDARAEVLTRERGKRLRAVYRLYPGAPYELGDVAYDIGDGAIADLLEAEDDKSLRLKAGERFSVGRLDAERGRITTFLLDRGYYRFNKDFINFTADSTGRAGGVGVTLHLREWGEGDGSGVGQHPRYRIRSVRYPGDDDVGGRGLSLRRRVLESSTALRSGDFFSSSALKRTYNNFGRLGAVRYTNIRFTEVPDSGLLDCDIMVSMNKRSTISFQPEGTNTAGDLGAAASLTFENRNLFGGSELLSVQLRGAFEAIRGLEGYQNEGHGGEDYEEYSVVTKLVFPRFVAPLLSSGFRRRSSATSELSLTYDLQNRPEFHRRVFSLAWRYRWRGLRGREGYRLDLLDLNYVHMPWISGTFKRDYLDSGSSRNAILRYNYEDLLIMKTGFGLTWSDGRNGLRANVETAGNLLSAVAGVAGFRRNDLGQSMLFHIAFAQYAKFDVDYTRLWRLDGRNELAAHAGLGVAYPYGNSWILPFEKRYFSGGANSVRGWSVRELGPGSFRGSDGRIDFINQTGDMKLDLSLEYRTLLFWKLGGAAFVDAGNIWTLRNYADQPGGQFRLDKFYEQIALAYGLGLRLNFDYFVVRFDMGMKAVNPAYSDSHEHYAFLHPRLGRDFSFHFAVGLPF